MRQHSNQNRIVAGAVIIVFGVLALIDSLHIFGVFNVLTFWPAILILAGVLKISNTRGSSGYVVGGMLIALGVVILLEHMGLFMIRDWWPLALIAIGVLVLTKGAMPWHTHDSSAVGPDDTMDTMGNPTHSYLNVAAILSGQKLRSDNPDFRGGEITAVMGGVEIDLRQAAMRTDATLRVFALCGGIALKVPADWTVVSNALPILGGIEDKSVPPAIPLKRLIIEGQVVMGGVEIKN